MQSVLNEILAMRAALTPYYGPWVEVSQTWETDVRTTWVEVWAGRTAEIQSGCYVHGREFVNKLDGSTLVIYSETEFS